MRKSIDRIRFFPLSFSPTLYRIFFDVLSRRFCEYVLNRIGIYHISTLTTFFCSDSVFHLEHGTTCKLWVVIFFEFLAESTKIRKKAQRTTKIRRKNVRESETSLLCDEHRSKKKVSTKMNELWHYSVLPFRFFFVQFFGCLLVGMSENSNFTGLFFLFYWLILLEKSGIVSYYIH